MSIGDSGQPPKNLNPYQVPQVKKIQPTGSIPGFEGFGKTRGGLQLVYYGIVLLLFIAIGAIFVSMYFFIMDEKMMAGRGSRQANSAMQYLVLIGYGLVAVASIMMFVGQCMCITVPIRTGAKGIITASVGLQVLSFVLTIVAVAWVFTSLAPPEYFIDQRMGRGAPTIPAVSSQVGVLVLQFASAVAGLVSLFCFLSFIRKVALYILRDDVAGLARKVISVFGVLCFLYVLFIAAAIFGSVAFSSAGGGRDGLAVLGIVFAIGGLVMLVVGIVGVCMYTTLLRNTIKALDFNDPQTQQRMKRPASPGIAQAAIVPPPAHQVPVQHVPPQIQQVPPQVQQIPPLAQQVPPQKPPASTNIQPPPES